MAPYMPVHTAPQWFVRGSDRFGKRNASTLSQDNTAHGLDSSSADLYFPQHDRPAKARRVSHACQGCGEEFSRNWTLRRHEKTCETIVVDPNGRQKHPCPHPDCHRSFSRNDDVRRHEKEVHQHVRRKHGKPVKLTAAALQQNDATIPSAEHVPALTTSTPSAASTGSDDLMSWLTNTIEEVTLGPYNEDQAKARLHSGKGSLPPLTQRCPVCEKEHMTGNALLACTQQDLKASFRVHACPRCHFAFAREEHLAAHLLCVQRDEHYELCSLPQVSIDYAGEPSPGTNEATRDKLDTWYTKQLEISAQSRAAVLERKAGTLTATRPGSHDGCIEDRSFVHWSRKISWPKACPVRRAFCTLRVHLQARDC